jgi:hypothetical protein
MVHLAHIVIRSLLPSQIEWDTVQLDNPSTWANWDSDLKSAGLSEMECNRVLALVLEANCLDEAKLRKAREVQMNPAKLEEQLVDARWPTRSRRSCSSGPGTPIAPPSSWEPR